MSSTRTSFMRTLLVICLSMYGVQMFSLSAQDIHTTTNVYTTSGLNVSWGGSLYNEGFIQNQGQLFLKGNWINTATYQGTGQVTLNGNNQNIFNNAQPIHHLTIEGGGIKRIQGKVIIGAVIDMENGILLTEDTDTLLLKEQVEINDASALSYVDGALTATGTGYHFFPVGKNGHYHPIEFMNVQGVSPVIAAEVLQYLPALRTTVPTDLFSDIYWKRTTVSGSFESSPVSVAYDVPAAIADNELVVAEGNDFEAVFALQGDLLVRQEGNTKIVSTKKGVSSALIALGHYQGEAPHSFYFSTTLSPHASDPLNRVIRLFGDGVGTTDFLLEVYNRWGNLIYKNQSPLEMSTTGWDGTQNGQVLSSGVYPYSLKFKDSSGRKEHRTGFITIIN